MVESGFVLTVGELNEYVKTLLASDPMLRAIRLRGEISNLKRYPSGHWYFTLKDKDSRMNCVMFRQYNSGVTFQPRDGMAVVLTGSVGLFVRDGAYQFYATAMQVDGIGDLYLRFLQLKDRLSREGLFDQQRKRPLPLLPQKVGVITSATGAVIHDILTVSARRNPGVPIVLAPVKVQGIEAAGEIAAAIARLSVQPQVQVLIVGRGGGSLEDLWPFNEEIVARAIAASPVPVVSAVGHETDFTIADFAADVRAATPSQAAELVFADVRELGGQIDGLILNMEKAMQQTLLSLENRLHLAQNRLVRQAPQSKLDAQTHALALLHTRMAAAAQRGLEQAEKRLEAAKAKRLALGPEQVLARGYALAMRDGRAVTSVQNLAQGDALTLAFRDGQACVSVSNVKAERIDPNAP
ncbi:MAG: exodeoxyribonuclease VII large subunit [Clostridia bacterium]|nr:exodeoxyribonuclease VII large subunit [Clostridia bacterium]